ncbi:zinc-ribbon domain-containing protein [Devosia sp.]|uniref:zinc-ribbon domain-containing protein n=1 Tax=Devosia sp. TaxID=1871048 RepID=UPI001B21F608|nr:zinc-ribbon domain-containing protein [Devosia sp.]MBO9589937.1 zinc-ribbon domain-containing protein [Devosia sp.]
MAIPDTVAGAMIITCPNCQTKYQVTYEAIGSAGRKVQCASCHQSWQQSALPDPKPDLKLVPPADPESDRLFESMAEEALDAAIEAEEKTIVDVEPRVIEPVEPRPAKKRETAAEMRARQKALSRRQTAMVSRLPLARMRRYARVVGAVGLAGILGIAYFGRVQIVERNPDLAGLYEAVGLGVNVVGLELSHLQSTRGLSEGKEVLVVSAQLVGLMPNPVPVPPVLVSLLDDTGHTIYEWSVTPRIRDLMAGERATLDTRLPLPPGEAVKVRLTFAGGRAANNAGEQAPPPVAEAQPAHGNAESAAPVSGHGEAAGHSGEAADAGEAAHPAEPSVEAAAPAVHH